jgi:transcriptional regulator with XRE-family HTH domain
MTFTDKLTLLIKTKKISRRILAASTGISYNTICSWYARKSSRISPNAIEKIANLFGIEVDFLIDPSVSENKLLKRLSGNNEMLINEKTDQLIREIDSLKLDPYVTELDIQIAKTTSSLDTHRKAQLFIFINHFKHDLEEGKNVIISIGTSSDEKVIR